MNGTFRAQRGGVPRRDRELGLGLFAFAPYLDVEVAVHTQNLFGKALRGQLLGTTPRQVRFGFLLEQLPSAGNKVTIDKAWTDARQSTTGDQLRPRQLREGRLRRRRRDDERRVQADELHREDQLRPAGARIP